jgi:hypothetical protein
MENAGKFEGFIEPLKLLFGKDMTKWSDEAKNKAFELFSAQTSPSATVETSVAGPLSSILEAEAYERTPAGRKELLAMAREDAREKAKETLMFSTLAKLPESITNAFNPFGGPAGAAMYYQGMSAIPGIVNQTMTSYPQIQIPGSSTQQFRYFN